MRIKFGLIKIAKLISAANIYNLDELDKYLLSVNDNKQKNIRKWLNTTAKNWLIETGDTKQIKSPPNPRKDKSWVQEAIDSKNGLHNLNLDKAHQDSYGTLLIPAVEYLITLNPNSPIKVSFNDAVKLGTKFLKEKEVREGLADVEEIWQSGGFRVVELSTVEALKSEVCYMENCLIKQDYIKKVKSGQSRILSLRDSKNVPHVSIELDKQSKRLEQVEGKQNNPSLWLFLS